MSHTPKCLIFVFCACILPASLIAVLPPEQDSDGDQMADSWEIAYFGDLSQGPDDDFDGDTLRNLKEFQEGTDPTVPKTQTVTFHSPNGIQLVSGDLVQTVAVGHDATPPVVEADKGHLFWGWSRGFTVTSTHDVDIYGIVFGGEVNLGIPGLTFYTTGNVNWEGSGGDDVHLAGSNPPGVDPDERFAQLEVEVQGPAVVEFTWELTDYIANGCCDPFPEQFQFYVDGEAVLDNDADYGRSSIILEAGTHDLVWNLKILGSRTMTYYINDIEVTPLAEADRVVFPDPVLDAYLHTFFGLTPHSHLRAGWMGAITDIQIDNGVGELSGLETLVNLETLELNNGTIQDLGPLSGLDSLYLLILENQQITDLSPLSGLDSLNDLRLSNNRILDLSPVVGLPNLERLDLDSNRIYDVSPLAQPSGLLSFTLRHNFIYDLSPLNEASVPYQNGWFDYNYIPAFSHNQHPLSEYPTDLDEDGLLDATEFAMITLSPADAYENLGDVEPGGDFDRDSYTNLQEQEVGSDPLDRDSRLSLDYVDGFLVLDPICFTCDYTVQQWEQPAPSAAGAWVDTGIALAEVDGHLESTAPIDDGIYRIRVDAAGQ